MYYQIYTSLLQEKPKRCIIELRQLTLMHDTMLNVVTTSIYKYFRLLL